MTWQRQESTSRCDSCRAYWNVLQDLGEEWDTAGRPADPDGWGTLIGRALAAYLDHLGQHLPA
ncbi:hypothetical protein [Streptomyces sp. SCL15-4]|uniref:hypothetical protein n=1 Tax=Streptomyces sp. SCL15-4 TaxID=2967221 RepID=UPI0029671AFA|nr:hypothetical protein [Streptomyces sp. SCL15-4]